jgi:hypothetical protein
MPMQCIHYGRAILTRFAWIYLLAYLAMRPATAFADAGAVRVSQRHGDRQITVFTDPTPLRTGPIDVSVLVQDAATGGAVLSDKIDIAIAPLGLSSTTGRYRATNMTASNKLFQAANFDLPHAGWWKFTIDVASPQGAARLHFEAEAGDSLPPWQALWPWFCWPILVVSFYALFQFRRASTARQSRQQ